MNKFIRFAAALAVLVLMMSVGFGLASAQEESVLVIGWEQEPSQLNPVANEAFATYMDGFFARDIWDWDENNEIFPIMVEEIPTLENGLARTLENGNTQVEYRLHQGMLWSDGEEVTSADCEFWHRLMMNPDTGTLQRADYPDVVESFEVVDDYTFIMTYNTVYPDFLSEATASCQLPEHVLGPAIDAGEALDDQPFFSGVNPVGYGPYVFTEWRAGEAVEFNRNPNWGINEWEKEPAFDRVILRFVTEAAQMQNAMEVGDIDVAFNFSDDLVEGYQSLEGVEVFGTPGIFGDAIWVNVGNGGHPALSDKNVVRALIHAVDRQTLAEELVGPGTEVPLSWYPSQYWADDLPFIEYNVEEANRLLDEAGWIDTNDNGVRDKDGQELVLRFYTTTLQIRMDFQVFIQDYLAEVGVQAQLLPIPSGSLFAVFNERGILATGDFDLAIFALSSSPLTPYVNASTTWFGCEGIPSPENPSGRNGYGFCSPEFDELDAAVGVTVDPEERLALAQQAQHAFFEGHHWHGLYLRQTWYAIDSTVVDPASARNVGTLVNYFNQFEYWEPA